MKRRVKNVDILDKNTIKKFVKDCCMRHKTRRDFERLFLSHGMSKEEYKKEIIDKEGGFAFSRTIDVICEDAIERIKNRDLKLSPVEMTEKEDTTTGKIRLIGKESAMQQVFDYIAVYSCEEIFKARMVREQASSIKKRGQVYGVKTIKKWVDKDNDSIRYAKKHNKKYTSKCKYFVKLDIKKCYPNAKLDIFMSLFSRDCGNKDILWLWYTLLKSHQINDYTGFMIGALPSQWACQYMVSYIYRFAKSQHYCRRGNNRKVVNHMMIFMDDLLLMSGNRAKLKKTVESLIEYTKDFLGWDIKPNWHIREFEKFSIDMMGYVIHRNGKITIRAKSFVRARRMILRNGKYIPVARAKRMMSYTGLFKHSDSQKVSKKLNLEEIKNNASTTISDFDKENNKCRKQKILDLAATSQTKLITEKEMMDSPKSGYTQTSTKMMNLDGWLTVFSLQQN